jgi:hypothetical protein
MRKLTKYQFIAKKLLLLCNRICSPFYPIPIIAHTIIVAVTFSRKQEKEEKV